MPSTVSEIFSAAGLRPAGSQPWGTPIPESGPGVYVVALTADPSDVTAALAEAPVDPVRTQELLDIRPELRLDGMRPDARLLTERLAAFWLPDEVVLYIGLAGTSVRNRVGAYYRSPLGARRPHSRGWFLKTLVNLDSLSVHHAPCADPAQAEHAMLEAFSAGVAPATGARLHDPEMPIPFANLEWPRARRKEHGITGARGARPGASTVPSPTHGGGANGTAVTLPPASPRHTQRVTAADLHDGRIRFPRAAKALFPPERAFVDVVLRGSHLQCLWDPGTGPTKERSGVLNVPRDVLDSLVSVDEVLVVSGQAQRVVLD
ncbi:MAG: hypothetical protein JWO02_4485 [Solirubrobacterales bacterium]|nr:hypothetical protein [Solirubrobacterales bacterium]